MIALVQTFTMFMSDLRLWCRSIRHLVIGLLISSLFLIATNYAFMVRFDEEDRLGVVAPAHQTARRIALEAAKEHLTTLRYFEMTNGMSELAAGRIHALVSVEKNAGTSSVHMVFSGRNPLLDRELSVVLLRIATAAAGPTATMQVSVDNCAYTRDNTTLFMVAGTLPFLILALASVNCGYLWLRDWMRGTMYAYLATPVPRLALLVGRNLAGMVLTVAVLAVSLALCRHVVDWAWPARLGLWLLVIAVQAFTSCGLFFLLATWARNGLIYSDIQYVGVLVLMFISGTVVPLETMSYGTQICARLTPTFYAVRAMRSVMTGMPSLLAMDLLVLLAWGLLAYGLGFLLLNAARIRRET